MSPELVSRHTPETFDRGRTPDTINKMASVIEEDMESNATEEVLIIEESEEEMSNNDYRPNMFSP